MDRAQPKTDDDLLLNPTDRVGFGPAFERIVGLMARLRAPGGCPWDREQTLQSLRPFLVEEAYEVLSAIDAGDPDAHKEELGDLLLQVIFQAEVRREAGDFDVAEVAHAIADKLVRRHPHVFERVSAEDADQAYATWEAVKATEETGGKKKTLFFGVPDALPALLKAQRVGEKAARVGFDWPDADGPRAKITEELAELDEAIAHGDAAAIEEELGDMLFSLTNLARHLDVDAESALRGTVGKFMRRFAQVEARVDETGHSLSETSLEQLEAYWQEAKLS